MKIVTYLIIVGLVIGVIYFFSTAKGQRKELIQRFGPIDQRAGEVILSLKEAYPNHKIIKHTQEEYQIHCFGSSHDYFVILGYTPSGVYVRISYTDMLGGENVVSEEMNPNLLNEYKIQMMMQNAMG